MTWNCNVDEYPKSMHDKILSRYLLTSLVLYLEFYNHVIEGGDGKFERCTAPMVNLDTYKFKI